MMLNWCQKKASHPEICRDTAMMNLLERLALEPFIMVA